MNRLFIIALFLLLICQIGCSSIFNPDKTISAALASYFPDSDAATAEMESQLNAVVSDATRNSPDGIRSVEKGSADGSLEGLGSNPPITPLPGNPSIPGNTSTSWDKIEQAIEKEPRTTISDTPPNQQPGRRSRQQPNPDSPSVEKTQEKLIQIYDQINSQEIPKSYQPLPPLIQRPVIYDHSIVNPNLEHLQSTLSQSPGSNEEPQSDISWKDSLEATIAHLKEELKSLTPKSKEADKLHKCLNVLNSVDSDKDFVNLVDKLTELQTSLPQHQFDAIRELIIATDNGKSNLIDQLKSAVSQVSKSAELKILNATFCSAVEGFGKFERFPSDQFRAGDEVLLYCELQNFEEEKKTGTNQKSTNQCQLDAQVEFLDSKDETLFIESFANITDESESDRKDFYLFFRFHIPKLDPGAHRVQIRFNDKIGRKNATLDRPLKFTVVR